MAILDSRSARILVCAVAWALAPVAAGADRTWPIFELHGFGELQARTLSSNFDTENSVPSQ